MSKNIILLIAFFIATSVSSQKHKINLTEQTVTFDNEIYSGMNQKINYYYNSNNQILKITNTAKDFSSIKEYEYRNDTIFKYKLTRRDPKDSIPYIGIVEYYYSKGKLKTEKFSVLKDDMNELKWTNKYTHFNSKIIKETYLPKKNTPQNVVEFILNEQGYIISVFSSHFKKEEQPQFLLDNKTSIQSIIFPKYLVGAELIFAGNITLDPKTKHTFESKFEYIYNENNLPITRKMISDKNPEYQTEYKYE